MKLRNALWAITMVAMLSACAQLGVPTATTFNERLAVGYGTVTTVRQTATTLLTAKQISADDADNVLKTTDTARAGLDVARTLSGTNLTAADQKLTAIHTVLSALSTYLATRQK